MSLKRILLTLLTFFSLIPFLLTLLGSLNQPQIQANLQIYQTDFILQASEFDFNELSRENYPADLSELRSALLGQSPYKIAQDQYLEAQKLANKNLANLQSQLKALPVESLIAIEEQEPENKLKKEIARERKFIDKLTLKLGILQIENKNFQDAITNWDSLMVASQESGIAPNIQETATVLKELWGNPSQVLPNAEAQIDKNLPGWFRYRALQQLYQVQNRQDALLNLEDEEKKLAKAALIKLVTLNAIPVFGGILGFILIIFLLVQLLLKRKQSILAHNSSKSWQTPWNGEIIWQVLIVGFLFWGQFLVILLPVILAILGGLLQVDFINLGLRSKAVYVLFNYLFLAIGGLSVLYFSIKPFFPLDKDWFRFNWLSNWSIWGLGGYLVALPLVLIVSLINQQLWNGQGGSNPLLFLALEAQDYVVLAIFFFTASIAAPIYEEVLFRGFLLPSLTRYLPVWSAILISSFVFALAHGNVSEVIPLVTLGIILGVTYTRSRNLLSSMLIHSLWNGGTLLSLFVLGSGAN